MAGSVQDPSERSVRTVVVIIYSKSLLTYIYNKSLWSKICNKSFKTNLCHDTIQFSVFCRKYTGVIQYTVSHRSYTVYSVPLHKMATTHIHRLKLGGEREHVNGP